MQQIHWIEIDPVDTLFFKGTESMVAGENHEADTMFPPMPTTLTGSVRTAILRQNNIPPSDYIANSEKWVEQYPLLGSPEKAGFSLVGPLFRIDNTTLYPAPAHWMADISDNVTDGTKVNVQTGTPFTDNSLGLTSSVDAPFWIRHPVAAEMNSLAGYWVTDNCFKEMVSGSGAFVLHRKCQDLENNEAAIFSVNDLFHREERVGIALTCMRTAKEGHLYSTVHVRMQAGVRLLIGLQSVHFFCLDTQGIIQLGGEQRMCSYSLVKPADLPVNPEGQLLFALSPIPAKLPQSLYDQPRSSGKLLRVGGWDMKEKFHKPLVAWLPAGTVIQKNETGATLPACISI